MKVYVCYYYYYGWDGYSPPVRVFLNIEDAKKWTKYQSDGDYEELEIEGTTDNENCT